MNHQFIEMIWGRGGLSGHGICLGFPEIKNADGISHKDVFHSASFDVLDIKEFFGGEIIHDLNTPIPDELVGKYDFLINPGTYEHCFNIAMAMANGYMLLKPGAKSFHTAPHIRGKHGFWNFCKGTFEELYKHNGGRVVWSKYSEGILFVAAENGTSPGCSFPYEKR